MPAADRCGDLFRDGPFIQLLFFKSERKGVNWSLSGALRQICDSRRIDTARKEDRERNVACKMQAHPFFQNGRKLILVHRRMRRPTRD